jgi:hypothetical protein
LNCASAIGDHPWACFIDAGATAISAPHGKIPSYNIHPGSVPVMYMLLKSSQVMPAKHKLEVHSKFLCHWLKETHTIAKYGKIIGMQFTIVFNKIKPRKRKSISIPG